jgi:hypothetical protein
MAGDEMTCNCNCNKAQEFTINIHTPEGMDATGIAQQVSAAMAHYERERRQAIYGRW